MIQLHVPDDSTLIQKQVMVLSWLLLALPVVSLVFLAIVLAVFGKSFGLRLFYVNTLLKIFNVSTLTGSQLWWISSDNNNNNNSTNLTNYYHQYSSITTIIIDSWLVTAVATKQGFTLDLTTGAYLYLCSFYCFVLLVFVEIIISTKQYQLL